MLVNRTVVNEYIKEVISKQKLSKPRYIQSVCENIFKNHNIQFDIVTDLINERKDPSDYSDFIIYCFLEEVDNNSINRFFTEIEKNKYRKEKLLLNENIFPIEVQALQVTDDQWITALDSSFLMKLRKAQLIKYNTNTQRTLTKYNNSGNTVYKITLNKTAVKNIREVLSDRTYIPNTLTFNIPEEADFSYYNGKLYINDMTGLDIIDGYHRYVSMCQEYDIDNTFNYPVEVRFVCFSESKARQFIYQEDQKTQMSKVDSESFNQNNSANILVDKINADTRCNLHGEINTEGIINPAQLGQVISSLYDTKSLDRITLIKTKNDIVSKLNVLTELDPDLFMEEQYSHKKTFIVLYCIKENTDMLKAYNDIVYLLDNYSNSNISKKEIKNCLSRKDGE